MCLAIPGKIESIRGDDPLTRMGRVNFGGIIKEASLAYVPEAVVGDYVIVHVGFALSRVDEEEAQKVFGYLKQMEGLEELEDGGGWGEGSNAKLCEDVFLGAEKMFDASTEGRNYASEFALFCLFYCETESG